MGGGSWFTLEHMQAKIAATARASAAYLFWLLAGVAFAASAAAAQNQTGTLVAANSAPSSPLAFPSSPVSAQNRVDAPYLDLFPVYPMQVAGGYSFVKFFEQPNDKPTMNGFNYGFAWYPKRWIGIDGELNGTFGVDSFKVNCNCGKLLFVGGGPRIRRPTTRHWEPWAHALFGYTQYAIQRAASTQGTFGVEFGGGMDYRFNRWLSARVEANAITSTMYATDEVSPQFGPSIVLNY